MREFVITVWRHLHLLLTGGVLIALFFVSQAIPGLRIPWWIYFIIAVISLFWACYNAWLDQKKIADEATVTLRNANTANEEKISALQSLLDERQKRRGLIDDLSGQWANGKEILRKAKKGEIGAPEYNKQSGSWCSDVSDLLTENKNQADWLYFFEETKHTPQNYAPYGDLEIRVANLRDIIDRCCKPKIRCKKKR